MKRLALIFLTLTATLTHVYGQVARWLIQPAYEALNLAQGADIIVADSAGTSIFFSLNGRRVSSTTDEVYPFADGCAVATQRGTANITHVYDAFGNATPVNGFQVGANFPFFADGYLLVFNGRHYQYMNAQGQVDKGKYTRACPFSAGYASCFTYQNLQKNKDPLFLLLDRDLKPVPLRWEGRPFANDDVEFVSSVNEEGIGYVVARRKVFSFDGNTKSLQPVFATSDDVNIKNQAKLEADFRECFQSIADTAYVLRAKCGRSSFVDIYFNSLLVPTSIVQNGEEKVFTVKPTEQRKLTSPLRKVLGTNGKLALNWEQQEVLPAQFSKIPLCFSDKAVVQVAGRYGMLRVYHDANFKLSINKGNPMGFRHKNFETTLRLDMPPYIRSSATSIEVDASTGCYLDAPSKEAKNSDAGNFIQYNVMLDIPNDITFNRKQVNYPVHVVYDGLEAPAMSVTGEAWYSDYYTVETSDDVTSTSNGSLTLTFDIKAERLPNEMVFPYTFDVQADSVTCIKERVSEVRYKCHVSGLREGVNNIYAIVTEDGCPPLRYRFEIEYTKPVAKAKGPGKVRITKKEEIRQHLDI